MSADDLAALRGRVAELEAVLAELARLKIHKDAFGKTDEYLRRQPAAWERVRAAVNASATPAPDPRDARIAEVEQAAIQWRLRMAELETEAQESDARIAVLEAALRELEKALDARAAGTARPVYLAMIDSGMSPLLLAVDEARREARRVLGEETSGG